MMKKLKILNKCFNTENLNKGQSFFLFFFNTENRKKEQYRFPFYTAALYVKSEIIFLILNYLDFMHNRLLWCSG